MTNKILTFLFFVALSIGFVSITQAQSVPNFSTIKVDELSDTQLRQFILRVEAMGYTELQLEQMANAQGMPQTEIQKLKKRIESLKTQGSNTVLKSSDNTSVARQYLGNEPDTLFRSNEIRSKEQMLQQAFDDLSPKIFGSDLFKNNNITFEPNLRIATPGNYVIGPDDELLIDLSGDNDKNYTLKVDTEGAIRMEFIGPIKLGGLTIDQARSKLRAALSGTYSGLRTGRTQLAVNLGNIRGISVILNGQATVSGTYTLSSLSSVFNALYAAGGPNERGSYRNIQVIRNNKVIAVIDVYNFIMKGIQPENIRLQDQDIINIPVYNKRVEIVGEVKNPGIFESVEGETFQDILDYAGGFSTNAYQSRIKVYQNTEKERKITDIFKGSYLAYQPNNGDKFFVESVLNRFENKVEIEGAVFRSGSFALEEGLTLRQLIKKAEGLKEDAFINRGYIYRLDLDNSLKLISFDLGKVMNGSIADIILQREDKVVINSIFDLREEFKISINGEVRNEGQYDFATGMTLEDAIQIAGGFKIGATPSRIEVSRRIRNSDATSSAAITAELFHINVDPNLKIQDQSFVLKPFDIINIRSSESYQVQKIVRIEGEVLYPGPYTIKDKDERISDLVKRAGGLTGTAYTDGASLKRSKIGVIGKSKAEIEEERLLDLKRFNQGIENIEGEKLRVELMEASDLVGINLTDILKRPLSSIDLILEEGDEIRIPKQLQTVKVSGEVLNPNNIIYSEGRGFKKYINNAGGFSVNALKKGAYIKYANGSVESASSFLFFKSYPTVRPGSEIMVPVRSEREKMTAQSWIGIGTALASLAAMVVTILR